MSNYVKTVGEISWKNIAMNRKVLQNLLQKPMAQKMGCFADDFSFIMTSVLKAMTGSDKYDIPFRNSLWMCVCLLTNE